MAKLSLQDLSRQPLVLGTMCFTDPAGQMGYKTDQLQVSALVRIADALEGRTPPPRQSLAEVLGRHEQLVLTEIAVLTTTMHHTPMGPGYDQPEGPAFRKSQEEYFAEVGRLDDLRAPLVAELKTTRQLLKVLAAAQEGGQPA